jgi:hypothetical protein
MYLRLLIIAFFSSFLSIVHAQEVKNKVEGPRWRAGLSIQYATNFKNVQIQYPGLNYTGLIGGFTGRGLEIFGGYKIHRYIAIDVNAGLLINSYNRLYSGGITIIGRFNKFYLSPNIKFVYPLFETRIADIHVFVGGGASLVGSGRFYLENRFANTRETIFARYDPIIAPFVNVGAELIFDDHNNIVIGIRYQNGSFNATEYSDSFNPAANLRNAPADIKRVSAEGIGLSLGIIHLF